MKFLCKLKIFHLVLVQVTKYLRANDRCKDKKKNCERAVLDKCAKELNSKFLYAKKQPTVSFKSKHSGNYQNLKKSC